MCFSYTNDTAEGSGLVLLATGIDGHQQLSFFTKLLQPLNDPGQT